MDALAIDVRRVRVTLGRAEILHGVDLQVPAGQWLTVIGPNGAGKSTLLRAIGGLLPFTGEVTIFGTNLHWLRRRQRAQLVAMVTQHPVVPPGISVLDYVLLGRTPYIPPLGQESQADVMAAVEVLTFMDLVDMAERSLATLSGGERQRVFLARALVQGANLLLLDEPTSALDIGHQQEVLELVDDLRHRRGLTVVTTMHDLSVAGEYADQLVLLADGRVAAAGPPEQVLTEELLTEHYRARIQVIPGKHGPVVVPVRR